MDSQNRPAITVAASAPEPYHRTTIGFGVPRDRLAAFVLPAPTSSTGGLTVARGSRVGFGSTFGRPVA